MRKAFVIALLGIAALLPLLRYQPAVSVAHPAAAPAPPASSATSSAPPRPPGDQSVVDGPTVDSDFGPYQVRVTFAGDRITDVALITEPGDRHSRRIAGAAEPTLRQEALQAQSAHIDTVSGATATSEAYAQSLQGALDAKGH
ncbi:FMN-binding protein [Amycolatopsis pithecellobii]|uniref:FMN-binding protein n=1 Tax=Amycolatopsis pithecellobii TaxID=664692 RepID=A0A6N7Z077_9PSEU|nr:FMN-binding protein [Amycolatopsis pithecellobii]MTD53151.1 FMN-binding protein [Amycolatopsis pithecellobii]